MDNQEKMPIAPIGEQVIAAMRRASAMTLPDDPSAARMKATDIRRRFWASIFGERGSLLAEVIRVIGEVNEYLVDLPTGGASAEGVEQAVREHDTSEGAHGDIRALLRELDERLENMPTGGTSAEDVEQAVREHDTNEDAHGDIRALLRELDERLENMPTGGGDGDDGAGGITPHIGTNGNWWIGDTDTGVKAEGKDGADGKDGTNGKDGADGYTPVKGTDYFTEADKAEIVSAVLANAYTYGTEDIEAGSASTAATGTLHFIYE